MANTTNFGWETPDDTDLVKDGAAAMRTLGNAIDTSMVDLKGGTTGQILSKTSNTDMDFTWIANDQGDITGVTAGTGLSGGGTTGAVTLSIDTATTVDKTTAQTLTNKTLTAPIFETSASLTNQAEIRFLETTANGSNYVGFKAPASLSADKIWTLPSADGTSGQYLKTDGSGVLSFGTISSSPSFVGCDLYQDSGQSVNNNSATIITFNQENLDTDGFHSTSADTGRITIPSGKDGKYLIYCKVTLGAFSTGSVMLTLRKNASAVADYWRAANSVSGENPNNVIQLTSIQSAVATDYFDMRLTQTSGSAKTVEAGPRYTAFAAIYLGA